MEQYKSIIANFDYKDKIIKEIITKDNNVIEAYEKANKSEKLTDKRIDALLKGNKSSDNKPFVTIVKEDNNIDE